VRTYSSWLIGGAVLALAVLAVADGIRSKDASPASQPAPERLSVLHGLLVASDAGCVTRAVRLPSLADESSPRRPDCGERVWSDDGTLVAHCHRDITSLASSDGRVRFADVRGCAPAWRPDGALSVVRDGEIVVVRRRGPEQVFFTRERLGAALRTLVERPETYSFVEVQWFGLSSFVALVRGERPWETAAAVFARGGLESFFPQFGGHIESLRASPLGNYAFARTDPGRQYVMVTRGGEEMRIPGIANARALTWSPDESWIAIATRTATFIAHTGSSEVFARVPFGARALDWRP
jgi:hypothetical protein